MRALIIIVLATTLIGTGCDRSNGSMATSACSELRSMRFSRHLIQMSPI